MAAGIGAGVYRDYGDAVAKVVQVERVHQPDDQATPHYRARYQEYLAIMEAMKEPWNRLAKLCE
jgi:L-xylulokinase